MSSARKCCATQVEDAVDAHLTLSTVGTSRASHFLPMKDVVGPQRLTFSTNGGILNGKLNLLMVLMRRNSKMTSDPRHRHGDISHSGASIGTRVRTNDENFDNDFEIQNFRRIGSIGTLRIPIALCTYAGI